MGLPPYLPMDTIYILNLENGKYTILFKNYSNIDGKIFIMQRPCQSEQDNVIKVKNILMLCENVSLNVSPMYLEIN